MKNKKFHGLFEAYTSIYTLQEQIEQLDEAMSSYEKNRKRAAQRAAARNEARKQGKTGAVPGVGYVSPRPERETWTDEGGKERHKSGARMPQKESYDLFDTILEHLVAEGYADTNEAALVIMANMSEEWRQSIVDDLDENLLSQAATGVGYVAGAAQNAAERKVRNVVDGARAAAGGFKSGYEKARSGPSVGPNPKQGMGGGTTKSKPNFTGKPTGKPTPARSREFTNPPS
jgi:hypothetical protein